MTMLDYNLIMKDSIIRQSWLDPTVEKIKAKAAGRMVPEKTFIELREKLSYYPVENGVVVIAMPKIPEDKEVIFVGDAYDENMVIGFGFNKNDNREKLYTLVVSFGYKPLSETIKVDRDGLYYVLRRRGVNISAETIAKMPNGMLTYKLHENGKSFNAATKNTDGQWFEQTPNEKGSFVPNRIIAKLVGNILHVQAPQKKCKAHQRTVIIE